MRVAIAYENGRVAMHFGRCPAFLIVDIDEDGNVISQNLVENPAIVQGHTPGLVPGFLKNLGVNVIIAGGMGPKAVAMLESFGIQPILGVTGPVEEVLAAFIQGTLLSGESLCDHSGHPCSH